MGSNKHRHQIPSQLVGQLTENCKLQHQKREENLKQCLPTNQLKILLIVLNLKITRKTFSILCVALLSTVIEQIVYRWDIFTF
jgi:hypothetical protein